MTGKSAQRAWGCVALLTTPLLIASRTRADDLTAEAEALIRHGVELRRASRNAEALSEFQRANELVPSPRAQAQIALALHALGDWLGAERGLEKALAAASDAWIAQYREALEGALATVRAHLGRLSVSANVPSGEVLVNGVSVHSLPLTEPIRVVAGDLDVTVRAPGYAPVQRTLEVLPQKEIHVDLVLEPLPRSLPSLVSASASSATSSAVSPAPRAVAAPQGPLAYVALAGSGLLAAGGVVAWRVHEDQAAIYNDDSRCLVGTRTREQQCGAYSSAANEALAVEVGAFGLAGAAAGVGVWLLIPTMNKASRLEAWCAPWGGVGLSCGGAF